MNAHLAGITTPIYARPAAPPHRVAPPPARSRGSLVAVSPEDRQGFNDGVRAERRRWARVLASSAFAGAPVAGAHMLANTSMSAGDIIGSLRQIAADAKAAPDVRKASIQERWVAAFQRASVPEDGSADDGPRPSRAVSDRWSAAMRRAGVV